tara:strand:+ start:74 stop:193 length:120 start_codon:yes stop_codon:yes gene_type:complete
MAVRAKQYEIEVIPLPTLDIISQNLERVKKKVARAFAGF